MSSDSESDTDQSEVDLSDVESGSDDDDIFGLIDELEVEDIPLEEESESEGEEEAEPGEESDEESGSDDDDEEPKTKTKAKTKAGAKAKAKAAPKARAKAAPRMASILPTPPALVLDIVGGTTPLVQLPVQLPTPSVQLPTPSVQLPTPSVQLPTPSVQLPTPSVQLPTPSVQPPKLAILPSVRPATIAPVLYPSVPAGPIIDIQVPSVPTSIKDLEVKSPFEDDAMYATRVKFLRLASTKLGLSPVEANALAKLAANKLKYNLAYDEENEKRILRLFELAK